MTHLPDLVRDLGIILMTGALVSILFKKLKQPLVLGYLIAGFFLGPNFPFFFTVKDTESVKIWAELGVIFLLFGLGLEFSFKKISNVGKTAGIGALIETMIMLILGFSLGQLLSFSYLDSIFLGAMVSISSTTIIVKALEELNLKGKEFVNNIFGILVFEDLIAILILVILTTLGISKSISGTTLIYSILKLGFFLVIWFIVGIFIIPQLLKFIRNELNEESTIIISLGLCLMMVLIASAVGFSAPLGAFIMGSILAETIEGKKIEHYILPIQKLFAAIFFVSVGMMISFNSIILYYKEIIFITSLVILGKIFSVTVGSIISGQKLKTSIHTGFSLAQIGEFSFIIATLGMSLKVTSEFLYPIAVAVSAITTFTTPYTMKLSFSVIPKIENALPNKLIAMLNNYYISMNTKAAKSSMTILWETYGIKITLNSIIIIAITLFSKHIVYAYLLKHYLNNIILLISITIVTLLASAPFFWAIMFDTSMQVKDHESSTIQTIQNLLIGMTAFRLFVGLILTLFLLSQFIYIYFALLLTMAIVVFGTLFFRNLFSSYYLKLEHRFLKNLNQKEMDELHLKRKIPHLAPWDAVLTTFTVSPHSPICGLSLQDSKLKEKYNITIAIIDRGGKLIIAPTRDMIIMNADRLHIIGSEEMLEKAGALIEYAEVDSDIDLDSYKLESFIIHSESPFINKSIKSCGIREKINGLIVGIERNGERILSPNSEMLLTENDLIWLVGDSRKLNEK